jgi:hypothetical protein
MMGFGAISSGAISAPGAVVPVFNVTGFLAPLFGTPTFPSFPHTVQGFLAVAFGTPVIPVDVDLQVSGFLAVNMGQPSLLRFTSGAPRPVRIHMSGFVAPRFGTPTLL